MARGAQLVIILEMGGNLERSFLGGTECAISDGEEIRAQTDEFRQSLLEAGHRGIRFWRKQLERNRRFGRVTIKISKCHKSENDFFSGKILAPIAESFQPLR